MRFIPLGSGSSGNATLVEFAGARLLVDAGLSARQLKLRLELVGVDPESVKGILLSHEHSDHTQGAARFSKKFGATLLCSRETLDGMECSPAHIAGWEQLPPSGISTFQGVQIDTFPVPHDAARPVGFVLAADGLRVGVATDLGHATTLVVEKLKGCDLIMVESNHDLVMLREGPYPWHLKQRVSSRMGHLSNDEAAALLARVVDKNCKAVVLCHLSGKNNRPALARDTAARALQRAGGLRTEMRVARQRHPTPAIELFAAPRPQPVLAFGEE